MFNISVCAIVVDDTNTLARTQSFSAKIMKTTQGLARKFSNATTATRASTSSDNIRDIRDTISESPDDSPRVQRKNAHADRNSLVSKWIYHHKWGDLSP